MSITLTQICQAVETTLGAATGISYSQTFSELKEGIIDVPLLQVYPESIRQDAGTQTDRTTFGAGVRQTEVIVHADLYARQRKHLGEDMAALVPLIDATQNKLEEQDRQPYFGLDGIKAFSWSAQRVIFNYGDPQVGYVGTRFILVLRVF